MRILRQGALFAVLSATLFVGGTVLPGCSTKIETPGLANKGILPLSTTDPYLGSNIFIAREMETSSYLYNFIKTRGAPIAIELTDTSFHPPHMLLFYPAQKEVYAAELLWRKITLSGSKTMQKKEWIIRGPYLIEREDYRTLAGLEMGLQGQPVLVLNGKIQQFTPARKEQDTKRVAVAIVPPTPPPTPTPVKKRGPAKAAPEKSPVESEEESLLKNFKPLNLDQRAILISKGYADRADNGDLLHRIAYEGENLDMIARWYTGSSKTVEEIAKFNNYAPNAKPDKGEIVRIPLALLKRAKAMPRDFK